MSAFDAQCVQQARSIGGHFVKRIRDVGLAVLTGSFHHGADIGKNAVPFLRQANIAIVEADDAQSGLGETIAELVVAKISSGCRSR